MTRRGSCRLVRASTLDDLVDEVDPPVELADCIRSSIHCGFSFGGSRPSNVKRNGIAGCSQIVERP